MLTTTKSTNFGIEIQDSTVSILPGTARIGNKLYPFTGTRTTYSQMLSFGPTDVDKYQNILLYLNDPTGMPNLDSAASLPVSSLADLNIPAMPDSSGFPLSLFTFLSPDGTKATLVSYTAI